MDLDLRDAQFWFDLGMRIGPRAKRVRRKYDEARCSGYKTRDLALYLRRLIAIEERDLRLGDAHEG